MTVESCVVSTNVHSAVHLLNNSYPTDISLGSNDLKLIYFLEFFVRSESPLRSLFLLWCLTPCCKVNPPFSLQKFKKATPGASISPHNWTNSISVYDSVGNHCPKAANNNNPCPKAANFRRWEKKMKKNSSNLPFPKKDPKHGLQKKIRNTESHFKDNLSYQNCSRVACWVV